MNRHRIFKRKSGVYYLHDKETGKHTSLKTKDSSCAQALLNARNEASRNSSLNRQVAKTYLAASDPDMARRTWADVVEAYLKSGPNRSQATLIRLERAAKAPAMRELLAKPLIETRGEDLLRVMAMGGVSVNCFLKRWYNCARDLDWLPHVILPPRRWPKVQHKPKRAITEDEHVKLLVHIQNAEWRDYLTCLWWTGAAQTDMAMIAGENVDLKQNTLRFQRRKLQHTEHGWVDLTMGPALREIVQRRNADGHLFPYLATLEAKDRADYFAKYARRAGVSDEVTLHSYRYAVVQRMKRIGFNERFAMALVGHHSSGVHDKYAKGADMLIPSLEQAERSFQKKVHLVLPT